MAENRTVWNTFIVKELKNYRRTSFFIFFFIKQDQSFTKLQHMKVEEAWGRKSKKLETGRTERWILEETRKMGTLKNIQSPYLTLRCHWWVLTRFQGFKRILVKGCGGHTLKSQSEWKERVLILYQGQEKRIINEHIKPEIASFISFTSHPVRWVYKLCF